MTSINGNVQTTNIIGAINIPQLSGGISYGIQSYIGDFVTYEMATRNVDLNNKSLFTTGYITGINVTSGLNPGHTHTTDYVTEGSNLYFTTSRVDAEINAFKGLPNTIASLGSDGKVPTNQLPATTITTVEVVNDEAAMLALNVGIGTVAIRLDNNQSYILQSLPASVLGNWQILLAQLNVVTSVNGATGNVYLTTTNITEGTNLYFTNARAISAVGGTLSNYVPHLGLQQVTIWPWVRVPRLR